MLHVQCESARRATATGAPEPQARPTPRTLSACIAQSPLMIGVMTIVMTIMMTLRTSVQGRSLYPLFIFAPSEGLLPRPRGLCHQNKNGDQNKALPILIFQSVPQNMAIYWDNNDGFKPSTP